MNRKLSRRNVLLAGLRLPLAGGAALALAACDGGDDGATLVCAGPGSMTSAQESVRRSLSYAEASPDPAETCAGCDFFKAPAATGGCGACEIFGGGAVNPGGRCDSWSADS